MATIKSYTDLEQSKKLAEILQLESADMEYLAIKENGKLVGSVPFVKEDDYEVEDSAYSHDYNRIACWSLEALLNAVPQIKVRGSKKIGYIVYYNKDITSNRRFDIVDACYETILKLNELKML